MGGGKGFQSFPLSTINAKSSSCAEGLRMGKGKRMEEETMWERRILRRKAKVGGTSECRAEIDEELTATLVTCTREKQRQR